MLFKPGEKIASRAIEDNLSRNAIHALFDRHLGGDWGDLPEDEHISNEEALHNGGQITSGYFTGYGKIYIITDEKRRKTRMFFADEYKHIR